LWAKAAPGQLQPAVSLRPQPRTLAHLRGLGGNQTADTLRHMAAFVQTSLRDPAQSVRETALRVTRGCQPSNRGGWFPEIHALHAFVRDQITYRHDPDEFELVQSPAKTLEYRAGDCDDKATLLAALLKCLGHPARFVAVGRGGQSFSHVAVETKVNNTGFDTRDWMFLETIVPVAPGWYPPGVTSRYVYEV
jgi:transglutaminase-like putative cysteine protease